MPFWTYFLQLVTFWVPLSLEYLFKIPRKIEIKGILKSYEVSTLVSTNKVSGQILCTPNLYVHLT